MQVKLTSSESAEISAIESLVREKKIKVADLAHQRVLVEQEQVALLKEIDELVSKFYEKTSTFGEAHGIDTTKGKWSFNTDTMTLTSVEG